MGVIEVKYSLILNFIILIWGGGKPSSHRHMYMPIRCLNVCKTSDMR